MATPPPGATPSRPHSYSPYAASAQQRFVPFLVSGSSDDYAKKQCAEDQLIWMKCFGAHGKMRCNDEWEQYNLCHGKAKQEYHAVRAGHAIAESRSTAQIDLMADDARREASPAYYSFDFWHAVFPSPLIPDWTALCAQWVARNVNPKGPPA